MRLSAREREVLELMAEGRTNHAIGQLLFISPRAVEKHVTAIFTKLGLPAAPEDHRRVLAVLTSSARSAAPQKCGKPHLPTPGAP